MSDLVQLDLAEFLAEYYFPNDPVQPLVIAEQTGLAFSIGDYDNAFDGLLEYQPDSFHMYLNESRLTSDISAPRFRFTAAHELGHYFIDDHRQALIKGVPYHPSFTEYATGDLAERQADNFAATLLMPPQRFLSNAKKVDVSIAGIKKLASLFNSSIMSTAIRYARSNVANVSVMFWSETERSWCWSADEVWSITKNKAYKAVSKIPKGSATHDLRGSEVEIVVEPRGTSLSQWFPIINPGSPNDRICCEEAVMLGEHGVLTLLHMCD